MKGKRYALLACVFFAAGIGHSSRATGLEGLLLSQVVTFVLLGLGTACLVACILVNDSRPT